MNRVVDKLSTLTGPLSCSHFGQCSGCTLQNEGIYCPPCFAEIKNDFLEMGILDLTLKTGNPRGWRTRAKLAVRKERGEIHIGLYRRGSHQTISIPHCQVHHPAINRAVEIVKRAIRQQNVSIYEETTGRGILRYLQIAVDRQTHRIQLTLVVNCQHAAAVDDFVKQLTVEEEWHSIWLNFQSARTNTIFGATWQLVEGEEFLWEEIAGTAIAMHPACFAQANLEMYEELIEDLRQWVPSRTSIVEYYAGVGSIGLSLVSNASTIQCCEINPWAERCFSLSASRLHTEAELAFYTGATREAFSFLEKADLLIVDPPRKGIERELLRALSQPSLGLKQICYVSCYWPSFRRDVKQLLESG